jgi:hypothetical protein
MCGHHSVCFPRARIVASMGMLFFKTSLWAAPLTWFPGPQMDYANSGAATVATTNLGNVLIGGDSSSIPERLVVTNAYWTTMAGMTNVSIAGGAVGGGDTITVYGGTDGTTSLSAVYGYSPSGDTPQILAPMNVPRSYLGYAPDRSRRAYAIGGLDDTGTPLSSAERSGSDTNVWSFIASLPAPRYNFPAVFDGTNSIYIFGGYNDTSSGVESASVMRYSVSKNTWTNLASLPVAVAGSAAAWGPDGQIYVAGGLSGGVATSTVQVYNPAADAWTVSTPLPAAVSLAAMGVDTLGRLVFMGGMDSGGNDLTAVWRSQMLAAPDAAPVFTSYPATNATYLGSYSSSIAATGNPQPVYLLVNGPTNMTVDYFSGAISWSPQGLAQIGAVPVTIRATNYAGSVDWSFTIKVPSPKPPAPANVHMASATENSVTLAWDPEDPVYGPITYGVFIPHPYHSPRGSGGGVNYSLVGYTTNTSFTIGGLAPNSSSSYDVNATGPGGTSGYSGVSGTTTGPKPPTNLRVTGVTSTTISLAWDPSPGPVAIVRYEVLGWIGGLLPTISYGANYTSTAVTITSLTPGTYEEWTVRAYDAAGNVSGFGGGAYAVNPVPAPATISAVAPAAGGAFQFSVSEGGSTLQTVLIQATTNPADPGSWVQIGSVFPTANPFSFIDTNATQYPMQFYRVVSP